MKSSLVDFSPQQWEFLATLYSVREPMTIEVIEKVAPLSPAQLLDLIHRAPALGLLQQTDHETFQIAQDMPEAVVQKLEPINTPERISHLLKILQENETLSHLAPTTVIGLLERSGRVQEACLFIRDLANRAIEGYDYEMGLQHLEKAIQLLSDKTADPDNVEIFTQSVLDYSKLSYRLGKSLGKTSTFLQQARVLAIKMGNRRSMAMTSLHIGRFFHYQDRLEDALNILSTAYNEVKALGDDEILMQSAEFLGLYYFIQGRYEEAAEHLDRAMHALSVSDDKTYNYLVPVYLGYCTAMLGQFHRAIGVLDCNWRRAQLTGENAVATHFRCVLGTVLLMMGKKDEAHEHLQAACDEAIRDRNGRGLFLARKGLSYFYLLDGRVQESYDLTLENVATAAPEHNFGPKYILQFVLEMLHAYKRAGLPPVPEFDFDREIESAISGVNVHLRGVAYRIRALEAMDKNEPSETVREFLQKSEQDLMLSGDLTELARTRAHLARMKLHEGDREAALALALQAREGLSAYGQAYFPNDLRSLLNIENPPSKSDVSKEEILERFMDLMDELIPSMDLNELSSRLVASTCRFFGAERGGLFTFPDREGTREPVLKVAYNLSTYDIQGKEFKQNLKLIHRAFTMAKPLLVHHKQSSKLMPDMKTLSVLCLPFEYQGQVHGVLYHENSYIDKSFDFIDQALIMRLTRHLASYVSRIIENTRKTGRLQAISQSAGTSPEVASEMEIMARNPAMMEILRKADEVARTEASVLILGETGVGKDLVARRIHAMSPRSKKSFIVVDPSSIPENLVESELFGHEKGSFTGAENQRIGRMELAHKGTLFIDEVGDIPMAIQVKLLRALQEKSFSRVGGIRSIQSDFRLVAATNRDLQEEVARGNFREDLFYRLNVVPIHIPPLRKRGEDIILLAEYFLSMYARRYNRRHLSLSPEDKKCLKSHNWPGNVREIKNIIQRAVILSAGRALELPVLSAAPGKSPDISFTDKPTLDELQRRYIRYILKETHGKMSGPGSASEILGMKRTTLYNRMKKLGLLS